MAQLGDGDLVLLENVRFHPGDEKNEPAFARQLAELGDVYVNDVGRVGGAVRAGVDVPLGASVSIYPRLSLGYGVESFSYAFAGVVTAGHDEYGYVDLYLPLLVHPARHFFVGLGPEVSTDLSRTYTPGNVSDQSTSVGAGLIVGGWLGGPRS